MATTANSRGHAPGQSLAMLAMDNNRGRNAGLRSAFSDLFELQPHVVRGLPALVGIFGHAGSDQLIQRRRGHGLDGTDRRRLALQYCRQHAGSGLALERALAGGHLVEHGAQSEDVAARVGFLAFHLLRRHVLKRSNDRALRGQRQVADWQPSGSGLKIERLTGVTALARPKSISLAPDLVSMMLPGFRSRWTTPLRWARSSPSAISAPDAEYLLQRERTFDQARTQRLAFQILHHQVADSVLLADVIELADVGVIERRNGARLALETFFGVALVGKMLRQNLDGDGSLQAGVAGAVDLTHAAGADGRLDLVGAEFGSRIQQDKDCRW